MNSPPLWKSVGLRVQEPRRGVVNEDRGLLGRPHSRTQPPPSYLAPRCAGWVCTCPRLQLARGMPLDFDTDSKVDLGGQAAARAVQPPQLPAFRLARTRRPPLRAPGEYRCARDWGSSRPGDGGPGLPGSDHELGLAARFCRSSAAGLLDAASGGIAMVLGGRVNERQPLL